MKGFFCNACLRKACLIFLYGSFKSFLVACTRLYNLPCPLVGQSVSWSHCILFYDFISLTSLLLPKWCFFLSLASSFFFALVSRILLQLIVMEVYFTVGKQFPYHGQLGNGQGNVKNNLLPEKSQRN